MLPSFAAFYASDDRLTVGNAALQLSGGKDLQTNLAERFKCKMLQEYAIR
jgi:hypothetical protein